MFRFVLYSIFFLIPVPAVAAQKTILIIGDSISAAYGMPVDQGWVALLKKRLLAEQLPFEVINLSVSGDTSANAYSRLPRALEQYQPRVLLLEIGGNDGLRGLSLSQMQQNLKRMITLAVSKEIQVMLLGIQLPPNYGSYYTKHFNNIYRQLANQYQIALVPSIVEGIGGAPELMQADGIHPNPKAQPMMLELVWPGLLNLISE